MDKLITSADSLEGTLSLPPDKSISHRAAMFAALHEGVSRIENFSNAADPQSTLSCLQQLGVSVKRDSDTIIIDGVGRNGFRDPEEPLDCGNSGTTMRLLSGIVGGAGVKCVLTGDDSLSARTMKRIIDPLRRMGIDIDARDGDYAPLTIRRNQRLKPLYFELPIPSAQLKSCVLLAGLFGEESTHVVEDLPSRDHTERLLDLPKEEKGGRTIITSNRSIELPSQSYTVPNDFSAAAFWLVASSIHPEASITLPSVGINPSRIAALQILQQMSANVELENKRFSGAEPIADLRIESSTLQPIDIAEDVVPNCIDEIPILVVAMLFADGVSSIRGAEELRHKETDRLSALGDMLNKAGADFTEYKDGLEVRGSQDFVPEPASYSSFHDHRIAMSAAVLALMSGGSSEITDAECTAISYPGFWNDLELLTN